MNKQTDPIRYVMAIFLLIGVIFSGVTIYLFKSQRDFLKTAIQVNGRVINLQRGGKGGKAPVVEYADKDGKTHFYYHNVYSKPSSYSLGEQVNIFYNPTDTEDARLGGDYVVIIIFGFLGLIFTFVSVVCIKIFWKPM